MASKMSEDLRSGALVYHRLPKPGKLEIKATKPLGNQRDLALAYSPGVAVACEAIAEDPTQAAELTARQNLVAVISNGTAVLGLGDIGPLASKPVMEGKAVLFKKFAGIDVFDIEIDAREIDRCVEVVAALEPTFGGINLEDIKGPDCFEIEARLRERMKIPVFHDDQHGTAIIVGAAVVNALELAGKKIGDVKIVASGAGAAALACLNLLVSLGAKRENIFVTDLEGVVYEGREKLMDRWKSVFAQKTDARTLAEVIVGADVFLGLSAGGVMKAEMVKQMGAKPLILALANPNPEIMPEDALAARPDAMICTGRSDYPNQVNNVLCFPYIFRGALDVRATAINEEMKLAAVRAIAALAREAPSDVVSRAYGQEAPTFGANSLIPSPFDPRLILRIAPEVARSAMATGVAAKPIVDFKGYEEQLSRFVFRSGLIMKPIIEKARSTPKRVLFCDGEDERVLRATQVVLEEGIGVPILDRPSRAGRPAHRTLRAQHQARPRFRTGQSAGRSALPRLCRELSRRRRPQGHHARRRARARAHEHDRDRRAGAAAWRLRGDDLRPRRPLPVTAALHQGHCRPCARRAGLFRAEPAHHLARRAVHRRHACAPEPVRRRNRRHGHSLRRARPPLRHAAEDRAGLRLGFRRIRFPIRL